MHRPVPISDVLAELLLRKGYASQSLQEEYDAAWKAAVGETLYAVSRAVKLHRGALEVLVANNLVIQELNFQQARIVQEMQRQFPSAVVKKIRCRVGRLN